ncbi:MAG: two-component system NtrC family sensor kinase [Phenylobacterium sp.]|jgi:two-component system NtrC family sensor kinase
MTTDNDHHLNNTAQHGDAPSHPNSAQLIEQISQLKARVQALELQYCTEPGKPAKPSEHSTDSAQQQQHQLIQTAKLASMGQLTAGLAHELNQPLARIFLTAELAQAKLQRETFDEPQQILNYLQRIMTDVQKATGLINHLKTYSHQDVHSVFKPFDLKQLIDDAMILFNHKIKIQGIDFKLSFDHGISPLQGDGGQIEQVFNNLLGNAIQALHESKTRRLHVSTYVEGKFSCIKIEDSGCGMSKETVANIFDPFFTTKRSGEGTGLGLSISRGIIENHHGKLTVTSVENEGSCFIIWLPN